MCSEALRTLTVSARRAQRQLTESLRLQARLGAELHDTQRAVAKELDGSRRHVQLVRTCGLALVASL